MAIIIEEEKKASGLLNVLGWVVVLGIILAAIYYIFFVSPQAAIILPSGNIQNLQPIAELNLTAQNVVNSEEFQSLKQHVATSSIVSVSVGRANPFVSP